MPDEEKEPTTTIKEEAELTTVAVKAEEDKPPAIPTISYVCL